MTVVSCLLASDLDPSRLKAGGAIMLRDFLAYAEARGASVPSAAGAAPEATRNALRADLAERLRREGLVVHEEYGTAAQRVDVAIEDPYHRGRVLLAVETDGPRYAAMRSTRDRDRLRPEQLGRLGWVHLRVWSTDLFRDPAREIARILRVAREVRPSRPESSMPTEAPTPTAPAAPAPAAPAPAAPAPAAPAPAESAGGRRRRRVFRKGTAESATDDSHGSSGDDTDAGWGERAEASSRDRWLQEQRPPHYE
jgi:pyruvate/2-oxoglutarate dehydrogenase complex dihydrolipoamide acyltransferase (E2) component